MISADQRAKVEVSKNGVQVHTWSGTLGPGHYDFEIEQGATLYLPIAWYDDEPAVLMDLTGYTAALIIRSYWGAAALVSLSTGTGTGITLGDGSLVPNITVSRTAAQTLALTGWLRAVWDLELTLGAVKTRLIEGTVILRKGVTL